MNSKKAKIIGWVLLGLVVAGVAGFFGVRHLMRANRVKPFKEHLTTYTQNVDQKEKEFTSKQPIGKCITVDMESREVDHIYFDLPDELRAETPDEVRTIVQLYWGKQQVNEYEGGKPAYQQRCDVLVVDKATMSAVAAGTEWGSDPPSQIKSSQSEGSGDKPTDKVVNFLKGLPRQ
jgi:hypothetical protein